MSLRQHQSDFALAIQDKIAGADFNTILLRATPGAGKSAIPIQAAELIRAGLADRICWIVPRDALRTQGERNFMDPFFRDMLQHRFTVRAATNEPDPCRGTHGFVTTYQAVGQDRAGIVYEQFRRHRYILILDEFHHCELNGLWASKIQSLVDSAAFVVLMTGTLERGDNKPIAFLPYKEVRKGSFLEYQPDLEAPGLRYIEYSRADALQEQAIIPMQFYFHDGSAEWEENDNRIKVDSIAQANPDKVASALYTALRTDYAHDLLAGAVEHWRQWKRKIRTAKMLVVCADYDTAKEAARHVRKLTNRTSDIATSHESAAASRAIDRFKAGQVDILVTIAMAYEGLSVEEITHIACLTHIRSTPWLEQMVARAIRIDRAYQYRGQVAHIFAPDDPLFKKLVERIESEQIAAIENYDPGGKKQEQAEQLSLFCDELDSVAEPRIRPIGSKITGQREWLYGDPVESHEPRPSESHPPLSPTQTESSLKREIESIVRRYCRMNRMLPQQVNSEIKEHFGKSRMEMSASELGHVLDFVKRNYPTSYQQRGRRMPVDKGVMVFNG
jgi:superfamily II DNA or RNA helicase